MSEVQYGNSLVPVVAYKSAGTSATAVYSVSQLVTSFTIEANSANSGIVYLGSSSVDSTACLHLSAGDSYSSPIVYAGGTNAMQYDLSSWYLRASAASQKVAILKIVKKLQAVNNPT